MNASNSVRLTLIEARAWGLPLPTARATIAKTNDQCRLHIDTRNVTFLEQGEVSAEAPAGGLGRRHKESQANCDRDRISRTPKRLPFDLLSSSPIDWRNL
jgi:hypothetical protein